MAHDVIDRLRKASADVVAWEDIGPIMGASMVLVVVVDDAIDEIQRLRHNRDQLLARIARLEGMP
jgi:ubiquinone biosynthesis protein UbiJ